MKQNLAWTGSTNGIAAFFIFFNQHGQKFGEFFLFWSRIFAFVEALQFVGKASEFLVRANDVGERTAQKLAVGFFVEVDDCAHCFQAPRSYSVWVRISRTKTRCDW